MVPTLKMKTPEVLCTICQEEIEGAKEEIVQGSIWYQKEVEEGTKSGTKGFDSHGEKLSRQPY